MTPNLFAMLLNFFVLVVICAAINVAVTQEPGATMVGLASLITILVVVLKDRSSP